MSEQITVPAIYAAMHAMQSDMAATGLAKDETNPHFRYKYRGIDGALSVMAKMLAKHNVVLVPTVLESSRTSHKNAKGALDFSTVVTVNYEFVAVKDGTSRTVTFEGHGIDSGDKSVNKAMSSAFKLMVFNTFSLPVEPIDVEQDDHTIVEADTPPVPTYTEDEYDAFHRALDKADQWGFMTLWNSLDHQKKADLGGTFQKGTITAKKQLVRDIIHAAKEDTDATLIEMRNRMADDDTAGGQQLLDEIPVQFLVNNAEPELAAWIEEIAKENG